LRKDARNINCCGRNCTPQIIVPSPYTKKSAVTSLGGAFTPLKHLLTKKD